MPRSLEFFFDYGSPYSYLADTQLRALCQRHDARVEYRPMLLGGVFKATGNSSPAFESVEAKRAYGGVELRRWIDYYDVPFEFNPHFPIDTLPIMRSCVAAQQAGVFEPFHRAVYPAFWVEGLDLGSESVLVGVMEKVGLESAPLIEAARSPEVKQQLRSTTDEAVERGAFGAPTFFIGDEMFWGADRLPFVERALAAHPS